MKLLKHCILFFFIILNIDLYASDPQLWVELQDDWYTIDNVEIKDYDSYVENWNNLYKVDIFDVLQQYEQSIKKDSIRVHRRIGKIEKIIDLYIYVRSVVPLVSIEFNGKNLAFSRPSWNEYLFKIEYSLWQDNNLATLIIPTLGDLSKEKLMPAVFIVKENSINRIRDLTINIPKNINGLKYTVSFDGPISLKKLNNSEYEQFIKNPKLYSFNENTFWRTVIPFESRYLLKNSNKHKLAYKFNFKLNEFASDNLFLELGVITGADEVFINNKLVGKTGKPGELSGSFYDKKRNYRIPITDLNKDGINSCIIITHGLTDYASGLLLSNYIRITDKLDDYKFEEITDLLIIFIIVMTSIYSLIVSFYFKKHKKYFFLTMVVFNLALCLFFNSQVEYMISDDFLLRKKAGFIFLFLQAPITTLFFRFNYISKFSIFEKFLNVFMYLNLVLQFLLLLIPIVSNDISLYHRALYYVYMSWGISFIYIFILTIREACYYWILNFNLKTGRKELIIQKVEYFLQSARKRWNEKMKFIPVKFFHLFGIEIEPLIKIIMNTNREGVFFLIVFTIIFVGMGNDYLVSRKVYPGIKVLKYTILLFDLALVLLITDRFLTLLKNRTK